MNESPIKEEANRDQDQTSDETGMVSETRVRILQRPSKPNDDMTASEERSLASSSSLNSSRSTTGFDIERELLSLVNSTSECCKEDDGLEHDERFQRNCQVFNVSSEDFDEVGF